MKSGTRVPNGFCVRSGENVVLVDFDNNGKASESGMIIGQDKCGSFPVAKMEEDSIVLVHTVKGSDRMLVKELHTYGIYDDQGNPIAASKVAETGALLKLCEQLWEMYMLMEEPCGVA